MEQGCPIPIWILTWLMSDSNPDFDIALDYNSNQDFDMIVGLTFDKGPIAIQKSTILLKIGPYFGLYN